MTEFGRTPLWRAAVAAGCAATTHPDDVDPDDVVQRITLMRDRLDELAEICHQTHESLGMPPHQAWGDIPAIVKYLRGQVVGA